MQYYGETSQESLIAADTVKLLVTRTSETWYDCRVIERDGKLFARVSQGSAVREIELPDNTIVNQSADGAILVMFNSTDGA